MFAVVLVLASAAPLHSINVRCTLAKVASRTPSPPSVRLLVEAAMTLAISSARRPATTYHHSFKGSITRSILDKVQVPPL